MERRIYLTETPHEEALASWLAALEEGRGPEGLRLPAEEVELDACLGRVTAGPVLARRSSPHYPAAAMDGIAVRAAETAGAGETTPVVLPEERAVPVNTGEALPAGCDAVVMIEHVRQVPGGFELRAAVTPWENVRPVGEDLVVSEVILPEGHRLRPVDLGALLAGGVSRVSVRRRPRVAVLPTGTELVDLAADPDRDLQPGQIVEYNSRVIAGLVAEWGGEPQRLAPVPDRPGELRRMIRQALAGADVLVVNAGSSAGTRDYTAPLLEELGRVVVHGVALKPGRPTILAVVDGKPVLGLPGYPVTAVLVAETFLAPLLARFLGTAPPAPPTVTAKLTRRVTSPPGVEEFLRVRLGEVDGELICSPIARGAGLITTLVKADGAVRVPRLSQGFPAGAQVQVELRRDLAAIRQTILLAGSHDPLLDLLGSLLARAYPGRGLAVAPLGSLGGLLALARREAHLAGSHLLDEATGEYNLPFLAQYLPEPAAAINLVYRQQGFLVPPGNPKSIRDWPDLTRPDVSFINRQRGSGTRLLVDQELKKRGIDPAAVHGYDREEYTHTGVAAAIRAGTADVGLGLYSAARALDLEFIPVAEERYDLIILERELATERIACLLDIVRSADFREAAARLGGYDTRRSGERVN
ncbi:MAG: molybdopterin biosynthesis protein [Bacillota bacterium]|nr:molybdopterin biosynthesis protein [Bacillota bacterium]